MEQGLVRIDDLLNVHSIYDSVLENMAFAYLSERETGNKGVSGMLCIFDVTHVNKAPSYIFSLADKSCKHSGKVSIHI